MEILIVVVITSIAILLYPPIKSHTINPSFSSGQEVPVITNDAVIQSFVEIRREPVLHPDLGLLEVYYVVSEGQTSTWGYWPQGDSWHYIPD